MLKNTLPERTSAPDFQKHAVWLCCRNVDVICLQCTKLRHHVLPSHTVPACHCLGCVRNAVRLTLSNPVGYPVSLWPRRGGAHHRSADSFEPLIVVLDSRCNIITDVSIQPKCAETRAGALNAHSTSELHVKCGWYVLGTALHHIHVVQQSALSSLLCTVSFHWHTPTF